MSRTWHQAREIHAGAPSERGGGSPTLSLLSTAQDVASSRLEGAGGRLGDLRLDAPQLAGALRGPVPPALCLAALSRLHL